MADDTKTGGPFGLHDVGTGNELGERPAAVASVGELARSVGGEAIVHDLLAKSRERLLDELVAKAADFAFEVGFTREPWARWNDAEKTSAKQGYRRIFYELDHLGYAIVRVDRGAREDRAATREQIRRAMNRVVEDYGDRAPFSGLNLMQDVRVIFDCIEAYFASEEGLS